MEREFTVENLIDTNNRFIVVSNYESKGKFQVYNWGFTEAQSATDINYENDIGVWKIKKLIELTPN